MVTHTEAPSCTFDDNNNKTADCNYCGCSTSNDSGNHSPYNGSCLHCGASC